MICMKLSRLGAQARKKLGEKTDKALLDFLMKKPGALSLYQIAQELNWTIGRVQKSVKRLQSKGLISYKRAFLGGRALKLIVPSKTKISPRIPAFSLRRPAMEEVSLPTDVVDMQYWRENAFLYALDRITFGITSVSENEWGKKALFKSKIPVRVREDSVIVKLPSKISQFYMLDVTNYEISASPKKDKVLISVGQLRNKIREGESAFFS